MWLDGREIRKNRLRGDTSRQRPREKFKNSKEVEQEKKKKVGEISVCGGDEKQIAVMW